MGGDGGRPVIGAKKPAIVELEEGRFYAFCRCGRSCAPPLCDGSHRGTGIEPLVFRAAAPGPAALYRCKTTADPPYCDGSHERLEGAEPGDPVPLPLCRAEMPEPVPTPSEPTLALVHRLARDDLSDIGHHGETASMGVPRPELPRWEDILVLPAQLACRPLADDAPVETRAVIGPRVEKPLTLDIPLIIADMSFGSLSLEAKVALAGGSTAAGAGIASGEGGMLPEERDRNPRYLFELGTARFGWRAEVAERIAAFHFKAGQAAKTGLGGYLPGSKVSEKIARVRGLQPGRPAVSPPAHPDLVTPEDFRRFADHVRALSGGVPVGFKISANHIEDDIDFAMAAGADYIILDGRGGGTGAAPRILRDAISIPTIPALVRARRHLDARWPGHATTLVISGGLRTPADFVKALALGADAIAIGTAALQAIGCVNARICHTNDCPAGIATQREDLRARLDVEAAARRL
ncbi:MAG TPA: glutamate synthase, partial [Thermopetrobacter sp.]|nr:glutamate synthase [Thermopetrobacter sp.]